MASNVLQDPSIQRFVNQETQRQRFQGLIQEMTGRCWDSCMGNPSNKLDSKTETCIKNCVERFLDTSNYVVNRLESTPLTTNIVPVGGQSDSTSSSPPSGVPPKKGFFWNSS